MSYCPNCHHTVESSATGCRRCGAIFGGAAWKPIESLPRERKSRTHADRRSPTEKVLDIVALGGLVLSPIGCVFVGLLSARAAVAYAFFGMPFMVGLGIAAAICRLVMFAIGIGCQKRSMRRTCKSRDLPIEAEPKDEVGS
jgi:hypothetical protein